MTFSVILVGILIYPNIFLKAYPKMYGKPRTYRIDKAHEY